MTFEKFIEKKAAPGEARITGEVLSRDLPRSASTERQELEREALEGVITETNPEQRDHMISLLESLINQIGAMPAELNELEADQKEAVQNIVSNYLEALGKTDTTRMSQLKKDLQRLLG